MGNVCSRRRSGNHPKDSQQIRPDGSLVKLKLFFREIFMNCNGTTASSSRGPDPNFLSENGLQNQNGEDLQRSLSWDTDNNFNASHVLDNETTTFPREISNDVFREESPDFKSTQPDFVEDSVAVSDAETVVCFSHLQDSKKSKNRCPDRSKNRCNRFSAARTSSKKRRGSRSRISSRRKNLRRSKRRFPSRQTDLKSTSDLSKFESSLASSHCNFDGSSDNRGCVYKHWESQSKSKISRPGKINLRFDTSSQEPLINAGSSSSAVMSERSAFTARSYASASTKCTTVFESNLSGDDIENGNVEISAIGSRFSPGQKTKILLTSHQEPQCLQLNQRNSQCFHHLIQRKSNLVAQNDDCLSNQQKLIFDHLPQSAQLQSYHSNCNDNQSSKTILNTLHTQLEDRPYPATSWERYSGNAVQIASKNLETDFSLARINSRSRRKRLKNSTPQQGQKIIEEESKVGRANDWKMSPKKKLTCSCNLYGLEERGLVHYNPCTQHGQEGLAAMKNSNNCLQTPKGSQPYAGDHFEKTQHSNKLLQTKKDFQWTFHELEQQIDLERPQQRSAIHIQENSQNYPIHQIQNPTHTCDALTSTLEQEQSSQEIYYSDKFQRQLLNPIPTQRKWHLKYKNRQASLERKKLEANKEISSKESEIVERETPAASFDGSELKAENQTEKDATFDGLSESVNRCENVSKTCQKSGLRHQKDGKFFGKHLRRKDDHIINDSEMQCENELRHRKRMSELENEFKGKLNENEKSLRTQNSTENDPHIPKRSRKLDTAVENILHERNKSLKKESASENKQRKNEKSMKLENQLNNREIFLDSRTNLTNALHEQTRTSKLGKELKNEGPSVGDTRNGKREKVPKFVAQTRRSGRDRSGGARRKSFRKSAFSRYRKMLQDAAGDAEGCSRSPAGGSWGGWTEDPSSLAGGVEAMLRHVGARGVSDAPPGGGVHRVQREEISLVRAAIGTLRTNFRSTDPNQHVLDTLEQAIGLLLEKKAPAGPPPAAGASSPAGGVDRRNHGGEPQTKVIYFTERTVTPFMSTIPKAIGDVRLRDFKQVFDRPGSHRYHFKSYDPEYGMVKEEIGHDDDPLPGVDGKIIAWVEEDEH